MKGDAPNRLKIIKMSLVLNNRALITLIIVINIANLLVLRIFEKLD